MSVTRLGLVIAAGATNTSAIIVAFDPRYAIVEPSRERLKDESTVASLEERRTIALLAGSRRNRCEYVFCDAAKYSPDGFHATIDGSSSNAALSTVGVPPDAGTVAIKPFE